MEGQEDYNLKRTHTHTHNLGESVCVRVCGYVSNPYPFLRLSVQNFHLAFPFATTTTMIATNSLVLATVYPPPPPSSCAGLCGFIDLCDLLVLHRRSVPLLCSVQAMCVCVCVCVCVLCCLVV